MLVMENAYVYQLYLIWSRDRWGQGLKCRGMRVFYNKIKQKNKNHPEGEKNKQAGRQGEDWCTVKHDTLYQKHTSSGADLRGLPEQSGLLFIV